MNTQSRKLLAIAAVILFHGVVITVMLAQHGCKSDGATAPGAADAPAPMPAAPVAAAAATPAPMPVAASDGYVAPTRPPPETPVTPIPVAQFSEPLFTPAPSTAMPSAPVPSAPAADTSSTAGPAVTWIVSSKDSLSTIARKNGITVDELVAANAPKITRDTKLKPGMSLIIPSAKTPAASTPAATDSGNTYKVAAGDSLGKIATKNHTTVKALKEINGLTSDSIRAGQILKLPAAGAASAAATPSVPVADENSYTVKSGDSPEKIAHEFHISVTELMTLNGLTPETARSLRPGRVLKLPAGVHAAAATASAPSTMPATTTLPPIAMPSTAMPASTSLPPVTMPATATPVTGTGAPPITPVQQ